MYEEPAAEGEPAAEEEKPKPPPFGLKMGVPAKHSIEHCPDFDERMTLVDGLTRAVPYPNEGFNCLAGYFH